MKNRVAQISGILGMILIIISASLYAINSPHRTFAFISLIAGIAFFLVFLALNIGLIRLFFKQRSSRYGANMVVMLILFVCIIAIVQTLSLRHSARFDMTRNSRFSLASQTVKLLKNLKKDVEIYAFYKKSAPDRQRALDLLEQYTHESRNIHYEFIDPDHKPQKAKDMGVTNYGTTVVTCGKKKELLTQLNEENLTNAILKVTRNITKAVYFLQGHGEKEISNKENLGYSFVDDAIQKEGYIAKPLSLLEEEKVPDDCYILVVAGPSKDLFKGEIDKIKEYLNRGRNAIFMIDPLQSFPNIENLLSGYGIALDNDIIIDPISRIFGGDYTVPVVTQYEKHPITKGFNVATFFPTARSISLIKDAKDVQTNYLAKTGRSAWGEKDLEDYHKGKASRDATDIHAPVPIVALASKKVTPSAGDTTNSSGSSPGESKIVVFGDSDFASNASFHISGNADFLLNTVNYLAEEKDLISIRPKQSLGDRIFLTASQGRLVFLLSVVLLPLAVISFGTMLFVQKRKKG